jgi:hypothetical protein
MCLLNRKDRILSMSKPFLSLRAIARQPRRQPVRHAWAVMHGDEIASSFLLAMTMIFNWLYLSKNHTDAPLLTGSVFYEPGTC